MPWGSCVGGEDEDDEDEDNDEDEQKAEDTVGALELLASLRGRVSVATAESEFVRGRFRAGRGLSSACCCCVS